MVGFRDLVGTGIAQVSKKTAVKNKLEGTLSTLSKTEIIYQKNVGAQVVMDLT
jgi:hypothetical protein